MSPDDGAPGPAGRPPARPDAVRLSTLTARLGAEMDALAELAASLDSQIGALLEGGGPLRDPRVGVQDLDRLRQWATDLATVQRRLADRVPHDLTLPVDPLVSRLQLGALAQRLRSGACDGRDDGGAVEFF
ncbi:MAG: hypothetical protein ACXIU8_04250 [Alkalilacustris sp.]